MPVVRQRVVARGCRVLHCRRSIGLLERVRLGWSKLVEFLAREGKRIHGTFAGLWLERQHQHSGKIQVGHGRNCHRIVRMVVERMQRRQHRLVSRGWVCEGMHFVVGTQGPELVGKSRCVDLWNVPLGNLRSIRWRGQNSGCTV